MHKIEDNSSVSDIFEISVNKVQLVNIFCLLNSKLKQIAEFEVNA